MIDRIEVGRLAKDILAIRKIIDEFNCSEAELSEAYRQLNRLLVEYESVAYPSAVLELLDDLENAERKIKRYGKGSEALCRHFGVE